MSELASIGVGLVALIAGAPADATREDWPGWRGPRGDGVSLESAWTTSTHDEPLWSVEVGPGHSCPSVVGERLVVPGHDVDASMDRVLCLDAESGAELWRAEYAAQRRANGHGGGTLSTPAIAGGRVFVQTREGELRAFDLATGERLWERHLARDHGTAPLSYGFGGSPLVVDGRVVCNVGRTVAVDLASGATRWATDDLEALYSTPAVLTMRDAPALAVFSKQGLHLLRLADGARTGHVPWRRGSVTVNASTPVVIGGRVFISSGYEHGSALVDVSAPEPELLWESRAMRTKLSGCVRVGELLYGFDESQLKCLGLDGKERWRKRGLGMGALSAAGERLLVLAEDGELVFVAADPGGYRELARRRVFAHGPCWTSPVLSGGRLYLRNGHGTLVALDLR